MDDGGRRRDGGLRHRSRSARWLRRGVDHPARPWLRAGRFDPSGILPTHSVCQPFPLCRTRRRCANARRLLFCSRRTSRKTSTVVPARWRGPSCARRANTAEAHGGANSSRIAAGVCNAAAPPYAANERRQRLLPRDDSDPEVIRFIAVPWTDAAEHKAFIAARTRGPYPHGQGYWTVRQ